MKETTYAQASFEFLMTVPEQRNFEKLEEKHDLSHDVVHQIKSHYININTKLDKDKLEFLIGEMLWERTDKIEVMRCKGVFQDVSGKYYMLQGVQDLFEFRETLPAQQPCFLFVGRGSLDKKEILL